MNAENNIGSTIKQLRKKHGLSAKQLCEGLCPPSKLSKIEAGNEYPKEMLLNALMERMGELPPIKCIPLTDFDYKQAATKKQLREKFNNNDFDIAEQLQVLKNDEKKMTNLERQEYLYFQAVYFNYRQQFPEALAKEIEAIHITFPAFTMDCDISKHLFTIQELKLVNMIAITLQSNGKAEIAIALLIQGEQYYYSHFMGHVVYAKYYVTFANSLSGFLVMQDRYAEALEVSKRGI